MRHSSRHSHKDVVRPRHQLLVPTEEGNSTFELCFLLYLMVSLCLVYLNIYKTIWWLPHGPSATIVNLHAIDFNSACFLLMVATLRLQYLCSLKVSSHCEQKFPRKPRVSYVALLSLPSFSAIVLSFFIYRLVVDHKIWQATFLLYPVVLAVLFRPTVTGMLDGSSGWNSRLVSEIESGNKIDRFWFTHVWKPSKFL